MALQGSRRTGPLSAPGHCRPPCPWGCFRQRPLAACVKHSPLLSRAKHKAAAVEIPCHGAGLQAGVTCAFQRQKTCPPGSSVLCCCLSRRAPMPATSAAPLVPLLTHATGVRHLFSISWNHIFKASSMRLAFLQFQR